MIREAMFFYAIVGGALGMCLLVLAGMGIRRKGIRRKGK